MFMTPWVFHQTAARHNMGTGGIEVDGRVRSLLSREAVANWAPKKPSRVLASAR